MTWSTGATSSADHRLRPYWLGYLAAVAGLPILYFLLPMGWRSILFTSVTFAATAAVLVGVRLRRPALVGPWLLLAGGLAMWALGSLVWAHYEYVVEQPVPLPSLADVFFLTAYPMQVAALLWFTRARLQGRDKSGTLDSLIVATGFAVVIWVFAVAPSVHDTSMSVVQHVVAAAYPLLDLVLFSMLARFVLTPGARRDASFWLLTASVGVLLAADIAWSVMLVQGSFGLGDPVYAFWLVFLVTMAAAALHPSMHTLAEPAEDVQPALSPLRLAFLTIAAVAAPVLSLVAPAAQAEHTVVSASSVVLFSLVIWRMYGLMVDVAQYRHMEKVKNEFISMVSHELRTPLTSIRGSLGLLAGGALGSMPQQAQRMLDIALSNTDRLVRLINDILDIEKIESGQSQLSRQTCNAQALAGRAVDEMRGFATEASVELRARTEPIAIWADPDRIVQTLVNLVSNAVKYSPPSSVVDISVTREGEQAVFSVRDSGRGIPTDKLEAIFGRFQQVDASDARQHGGTGLGLAICRTIVDQHGGRIWAESTPGSGSTFSFTLPAPLSTQPATRTGSSAPSRTVLLVDDDPSVVEVAAQILQHGGYRAVTAATGTQALELAEQQHFDAVVLDLLLPDMSGWEVLAALRRQEKTRDVPVVILSAVSRRQEGHEGDPVSGTDFVDWVEKPFDENDLCAALSKAMDSSSHRAKALIVEDDSHLAAVLSERFTRHGFHCLHAATAGEAVGLLSDHRPDVVLLDLMLPDGEGTDVVERLNSHHQLLGIPTIVYTAKDLDQEERHQLQASGAVIFTKSRITPEDFEQHVLRLIQEVMPGPTAVR